MQSSVSIIIKTFERPKSLENLLRSIVRMGFSCPVLVADDSRVSGEHRIKQLFPSLDLTYITLPFDSGVSVGRNTLVNHVKTPYFVLCDDDLAFDHRSDLNKALACLKANDLDILGGDFYNYIKFQDFETMIRQLRRPSRLFRFLLHRFKTSRYLGTFNINGADCELLLTNEKPPVSPYSTELINNFFIAKTASVKKFGGWDVTLKTGEHEDFFLMAKLNGLRVAYLPDFGIGHYPIIKTNYIQYRTRADDYRKQFVLKHGFKHYIEKRIDLHDKVIFEVNNP